MSAPLYHLVAAAEWHALEGRGVYYPATYESDGFTHLTQRAELLLPVANAFYAGIAGDFLVLKCDPARLAGEVKFEPAAAVAGGTLGPAGEALLFPHLYGGIPASAVVATIPVRRDEKGGVPCPFLAVDFDAAETV